MRKLLILLLCAFSLHAFATNALLIVNSTPVHNGDSVINYKLGLVFDTVTVIAASSSSSSDANSKELVFISATVNSADVTTKFLNSAVPVIVCEQALFDDMKMTGTTGSDRGTQSSVSGIDILLPAHPLAAGLSSGGNPHSIASSSQTVHWGLPNSNAAQVASIPSTPAKLMVFGYENGASMISHTAPARRVGFFLGDNTATVWTAATEDLFDAAVNWAANLSGTPPTVSITAPAQGATYTTPADITITATAADSDGTVDEVEFFYNSTSIGTDNSSPFSIVWNDAPAGNYLLTAVAEDDDNLTTTSATVNITVLKEGVWFTSGNTVDNDDFIGTVNYKEFTIKVDDVDRVVMGRTDTVDVTGMLLADEISTDILWFDDEHAHTCRLKKVDVYMGGFEMGYPGDGQGSFNAGYFGYVPGYYSFGGGVNAQVSGDMSFGYGSWPTTGGDYAFAVGEMPVADGNNAAALGQWVAANDDNTMVFGSGIDEFTYLENDLAESFGVGFNSDVPTLIIGPAAGTSGSTGKVGIGIGDIAPGNKLEIRADANHESGLRFTRLTSSSSPTTANGKCLSVDSDGDVILVTCAEDCCEDPERRSQDEGEQSIIDELRGIIEEQRKEFSDRIAELESKLNNYSGNNGVSNAHQQSIDLNEVQAIVLEQNVPNPFAEQTTISYFVPEDAGRAVMHFSDLSGRVIKSMEVQKGNGTLTVFAQSLGSGTYTYSLVVDGKVIETKKMLKTR